MKKIISLCSLVLLTACSSVGHDIAINNMKSEQAHIELAIKLYDDFVSTKQGKDNLAAIKRYDVSKKFEQYFREEMVKSSPSLVDRANEYFVETFSDSLEDLRLRSDCNFSKEDIEDFKKRYNLQTKKRQIVEKDVQLFTRSIQKEDFIGQALWKYIALGADESRIFYNVRLNAAYDLRVCNVLSLNKVETNVFYEMLNSGQYLKYREKLFVVYKKVKSRIIADIEKL